MPSSDYRGFAVFDVDDVLADTRDAVRRAYAIAGVEMPADAWGKSWREWLPDLVLNPTEVHEAKAEAYDQIIRAHVTPLAGRDVAIELIKRRWRVRYLTGASLPAARAVLDVLGLSPWRLIGTSCSQDDKIERLHAVRPDTGMGVYIDDLPRGATIAEAAGWQFVRFTPDVRQLLEDVLTWTQ